MTLKTVLPLPKYTRRRWLNGAQHWAYYFLVPKWARKPREDDPRGMCPVSSQELGSDYASAVHRAEQVLIPQFESWRTRGLSDVVPPIRVEGTLDWLFGVYKETSAYRDVSPRQCKLHQAGFNLVGNYLLKDGRRLGSIQLKSIDTSVVDPLYEKLRYVPLLDDHGNPILDKAGIPATRERLTTINHAMKSCRRAWEIAYGRHPKIVPINNPFAKMGLKSSKRLTPTARFDELVLLVAKLDELGAPSVGTALMVTWEWLQREEHIFTVFQVAHYRPKERPDEVLIVHPKNGEDVWIPLFERDSNACLFPELMARLDAIKRQRIAGLMFYRDWNDPKARVPVPWATQNGDLTYVRHFVKRAIEKAGLSPELTFTSFRHGGLTELGDAELTDTEIRALSRQKSSKVLPRYVKRTQRQITGAVKKRRQLRTETGDL